MVSNPDVVSERWIDSPLSQYLNYEGDARLVFEEFESSFMDLSHNGTLILEVCVLDLNIEHFKAKFTPRICNMIADSLSISQNFKCQKCG